MSTRPSIDIFLKGLGGESTIYTLTDRTTYAEFTASIRDRTSIPQDAQRLIYGGRQMADCPTDCVVSKYNLQRDSNVWLVMRLLGGAAPAMPSRTLLPQPGLEVCSNDPKGTRHMCSITMDDDIPVARMDCGHYISADGMTGLLQSIVTANKGNIIKCPSAANEPTKEKPRCGKEWTWPIARQVGMLNSAECAFFEHRLNENLLKHELNCKQCPSCLMYLECDRPAAGSSMRLRCCSCKLRGVTTFFCYLCEQTWKNGGAGNSACCGNLNCQQGKEAVLQTLRAGAAPKDQVKIGGVRGVPAFRACPRKECRAKFGYQAFGHLDKCKHMQCRLCSLSFCFVCLAVRGQNGWPASCGSYSAPCAVAPVQTVQDLSI